MFNTRLWVNATSPPLLKATIEKLLVVTRFEILNYCETYFDPIGFSCVWILGESHCAIHTFPEENKSYVELSSCSYEKFEEFKEKIMDSGLT